VSGSVQNLLFTPEQVATKLGLHVKTVRRYIRDGELEAVKVGKRYRVTAKALEEFSGVSLQPDTTAQRPFAETSTIVSIDDLVPEVADRLATMVVAVAQGRRDASDPLHVKATYYPERKRLKVVCSGDIVATTHMLALINTLLENLARDRRT
jgi:excisionase family DNA binding protein